MKLVVNVIGAAAALLSAHAAVAATWNVSTNVTDGMTGPQQITNALARLESGDTILVAPGTYDFTGVYMDAGLDGGTHLTRNSSPVGTFSIVGDTAGHWDDAVVFAGDKRMMHFAAASEATGNKGAYPVIANITFDHCAATGSGGAIVVADEDYVAPQRPVVSNCVFKSCSATAGGGAVYGVADLHDSKFIGCTTIGRGGAAYNVGIVDGCTFVENIATNLNGGAVSLCHKLAVTVTNCTFTGNEVRRTANSTYVHGGAVEAGVGKVTITHCTFERNKSAFRSGAVYYATEIRHSTFTANEAPSGGGAIWGGYAYGCTFEGSVCTTGSSPGWDARNARLEKCDLRSGGVVNCSLNSCILRADSTSGTVYGIFYLLKDASGNNTCIAATNCLIVGDCSKAKGVVYAYNATTKASTFVNCTFADITIGDSLLYGLYTVTSPISFKNCVFSNIRKADGSGADLSFVNLNDGISFQNCCWGTKQDDFKFVDEGGTFVDEGGTFQCSNPRFEGSGSYQLRANSPLRGKGALLGWTSTDVDYAGNPRLVKGEIDIGCYQCGLPFTGLLLFVR